MLNAFEPIYDFTNWPVLFQVYQRNIHDEKTMYGIYSIVDAKLDAIWAANIRDDRLRVFEQHAVDYLAELGGANMYAVVYVLKLIYRYDLDLHRLDQVHKILSKSISLTFH